MIIDVRYTKSKPCKEEIYKYFKQRIYLKPLTELDRHQYWSQLPNDLHNEQPHLVQ